MPTPKVVIFGPFSKIESKIRKISKFQNNTEIALVDEFHRNLRQMKDLGLDFQKKLKKIIFDNFSMFYSTLNIDQIGIFEKIEKCLICQDFISNRLFHKLIFNFFFFCQTFSSKPNLKNVRIRFLISALEQKLWLRTCRLIFENPDFP